SCGARSKSRITEDGGSTWPLVPAAALPPAQPGEGAFAASGTCVETMGQRHAWIGTGAADTARVLRTADGGRTWSASAVPVPGGGTKGLAAVAFRDTLHGTVLGGDVADPNSRMDNVAITEDGGRTWQRATSQTFSGAVYGAVVIPGRPGWLLAAGPRGLDYSKDDGRSWASLDTLAYWSVGFGSKDVGWAVGPKGRITRIVVSR
ncbi:MAG TPA: sialidase family protein, partial [Streptosporangiaceae bacterium]